MKTRLALFPCVFLLTACQVARNRNDTNQYISPNKVEDIVEGETTKKQLVRWFGDPASKSRNGDGAWVYTWTHSSTKTRKASVGDRLKGNKEREETVYQELSVYLDKDGLVDTFTWETTEDTSTGTGGEGELGGRFR